VLLATSLSALAQNGPPSHDFIAARQSEVERMAELLYATHLNDGSWTRQEISHCQVFPHHAFARFDSAAVHGITAHFLAVYDLDHPPAHSLNKPWLGGVKLLLLNSRRLQDQDAGPLEPALIGVVNQLLLQEHVRNTPAVARCFVALSGEEPVPTTAAPDQLAVTPPAVDSVLTSLVSEPSVVRTESIVFDAKGQLTSATIDVHRIQP
jgi:hypothetical protein